MTDENNVPYLYPEKAISDTSYLTEIFNDMSKRFDQSLNLAQGRSAFQIEKYVSGSEMGLASQYAHTLKNADIMRGELFRTIKEGIEYQREFDLKWSEVEDKTKPIKWATKDGGTKYHWYDLDSFELKNYLNTLAIGIKDKVQQLTFFDKILDALVEKNGGPITREQFDAEEPEYWRKRLTKQAANDILSRVTGLHGGNLESIQQAAAPVLVPGSKNQVTNFPSIDLLIPGHPGYAPEKFLEQAQINAVQNYLEVSKDFSDAIALEKKNNPLLEDRFKEPVNTSDLLKQLGIGETNQ